VAVAVAVAVDVDVAVAEASNDVLGPACFYTACMEAMVFHNPSQRIAGVTQLSA
jgi:hypothetical protein